MTVRTHSQTRRAGRAALIFICALALLQGAVAANIATGSFQLASPGQTVNIPIVLDSVPGGISGYRLTVTLGNPSVGDITAVTFPDWATLKTSSATPADSVVLQAVDLSQRVPVGGAGVTLATITLTGKATGSTQIIITPDPDLGVQDRSGNIYQVATPPGSLSVGGAPAPTPTQGGVTAQPTPVVPTASPTQGGVTSQPTLVVPTASPTQGGVTSQPTPVVPTASPTQGGVTSQPTPVVPTVVPDGPTIQPTVPPTTPVPAADATYGKAKEYYVAGSQAWSLAWGASEIGSIRQYLTQSRTGFVNCLNVANAVNDPGNEANLALLKSISTAYIDLADAALAMYDGADLYQGGRARMTAGSYAAAGAWFQAAVTTFSKSQTLFNRATSGLQSVSYAGTEFGDGTDYTNTIVPILNTKASYMGEFSIYGQGWQHTALAYQASLDGDQATFRSEATRAVALFGQLETSPSFGPDATANRAILTALLA